MLDRKSFEQSLREARERQIDEVSEYLSTYRTLLDAAGDLSAFTPTAESSEALIKNTPIPRVGRDAREIGEELVEHVFKQSMVLQHPKFFSFVTSAVSPYSLAGAILSDIYNINAGGYSLCPGASLIEEKLIRWMGSLAGYGEGCGGLFTSGGSLSNLTGMIAARNTRLTEEEYGIGTAYLSDQAHSSVKKGLRLMGLRKDQIRIIPSDDLYKIRLDLLEDAIREDMAAGRKPFLLIGSLGTTNTGSIDPFPEMGAIKEKYGMWLHIDGAYGGSVLLSDIYRNLARGIELSDSLSWDQHKWAMQSYSCSCLIAKDKKNLLNTYAEHPEYLADVIESEHNDGWDLGIEMSRPTRAIKFWYTVQAMGTDLLADVIDYAFFNTNVAKRALDALPGWEITSPPMCGAITFRYAPEGVDPARYDELNTDISRRINESGEAYIVTTMLKGRRVLRLCIINGNSTDQDVREVIRLLDIFAHEAEKELSTGKK